jgi:hypothetical protein
MISEATENASEVVARSKGDAVPDATGEGGGPDASGYFTQTMQRPGQ